MARGGRKGFKKFKVFLSNYGVVREGSEHSVGAGVGAVGGGAVEDSEHSAGAERRRGWRGGGGVEGDGGRAC